MKSREKPHGAVSEQFMRHHYGASGFVPKGKYTMKPTVGRIVILTLNEQWADEINRRRTDGNSIRERLGHPEHPAGFWPRGAQAHIGNEAKAGQELPMVIVRVWSDTCVNGQVLLDGNDVFWATSVQPGEGNGTWRWPERMPSNPPVPQPA